MSNCKGICGLKYSGIQTYNSSRRCSTCCCYIDRKKWTKIRCPCCKNLLNDRAKTATREVPRIET